MVSLVPIRAEAASANKGVSWRVSRELNHLFADASSARMCDRGDMATQAPNDPILQRHGAPLREIYGDRLEPPCCSALARGARIRL